MLVQRSVNANLAIEFSARPATSSIFFPVAVVVVVV